MNTRKEIKRAFSGIAGSPLSNAENQRNWRIRQAAIRQKEKAKKAAKEQAAYNKALAAYRRKPVVEPKITLKDVVGAHPKSEWAVGRGRFMSEGGLLVSGGYGREKLEDLNSYRLEGQETGDEADNNAGLPARSVHPEGIGHKINGSHDDPSEPSSAPGNLGQIFLVRISSAKLESVLDDLARTHFDYPIMGSDGQYARDAVFTCRLCGVGIEYIREVRLHIRDSHTGAVNAYIRNEQKTERKLAAAAKKKTEERLALEGKSRWAEEHRFERELEQGLNFDKPLLRPLGRRRPSQIDRVDIG